ncbi:MAG: phosphohydrolase [Bacilli bacterium]|nr:phosphohydrolase [Bacilli bacterium]
MDTKGQQDILTLAEAFVQDKLQHDSSGHDWWHIYRVTQTAATIATEHGADIFVCKLAALLHDIADEKLNESELVGLAIVRDWLAQQDVPPSIIKHVMEIIATLSFKGGRRAPMQTLEGQIVQDADRLDAMGAMGISRVFAYSGAKGRPIHNPELAPRTNMTPEEYRNGKDTAINHFYEKLLLLKDLMNTSYGRKLAEQRHQFMIDYLEQFYLEWEGH